MTALIKFPNSELDIESNLGSLPEGPWFHFRQNNSGGYFEPPGIHVFIRAETADHARDILESQPGYSSDFCDCCGQRWWSPQELSREEVANCVQSYMSATLSVLHWHTKSAPAFAFIL